jgi:hypothetical protein
MTIAQPCVGMTTKLSMVFELEVHWKDLASYLLCKAPHQLLAGDERFPEGMAA